MVEQDDARLEYIPLEEATKPRHGFLQCLIDYWWTVHPERGLIVFHSEPKRNGRWRYSGTPQANRNEALSHDLSKRLYPWAEVRQLPVVFLKHDCKDYME